MPAMARICIAAFDARGLPLCGALVAQEFGALGWKCLRCPSGVATRLLSADLRKLELDLMGATKADTGSAGAAADLVRHFQEVRESVMQEKGCALPVPPSPYVVDPD